MSMPGGGEATARRRPSVFGGRRAGALENYLECYHCPVAHPGFSKVIAVDPDSYRLSVDGLLSSQVGPLRAEAREGDMNQSQYHFI